MNNFIKLFLYIVSFTITIEARDNPFIPTQLFLDEKEAKIEVILYEKNNKVLFTYAPLSFISIDILQNSININIPSESLIKHFILESDNKIILDFRNEVEREKFSTYSKIINYGEVSSIVIGDHLEQNYFRVVIKMKNKIPGYNVEFKDDMLIINKFN